jgi:integrase
MKHNDNASLSRRRTNTTVGKPRALPIVEWSDTDQLGWAEACRPSQRLNRGGAANHLAPVSRADIANRYGLYLDFLRRNGLFSAGHGAASLVTPCNVQQFIVELDGRVRSVTVWNSVYKLRLAAQLIAPNQDFQWLAEIERDIAMVAIPRSKSHRLVLTDRLVEAGLVLIQEAETFGKTPMARAKGVRNGLLIVLLALHPVRIKNFAGLTLGDTFVGAGNRWWLHIPAEDTKSHRMDERQVPEFVTDFVNRYLQIHRPLLCRSLEHQALWISSTTGKQMTTKNLATLISKITRETLGVDVSPHLFRTAGASTAAIYGGKFPHLGSALLGHRDKRVTEEHYDFSSGLRAGEDYASIIHHYREHAK